MCGRFSLAVDKASLDAFLNREYNINNLNLSLQLPRYNIAPGQNIVSVIHDGVQYRVGLIRWGFVPSFAKNESIGYSMINAKSETINEKPAFVPSLKNRRCVIIADGFYEWKIEIKGKQAYHIKSKNAALFAMAGLWSSYALADGSKLYTSAIITTAACGPMAEIHERMPVILNQTSVEQWLNPKINDLTVLSQLLTQNEAPELIFVPVSNAVNNVKNESIECIRAI
jgi:putative SOS response-associated peptidase YedK